MDHQNNQPTKDQFSNYYTFGELPSNWQIESEFAKTHFNSFSKLNQNRNLEQKTSDLTETIHNLKIGNCEKTSSAIQKNNRKCSFVAIKQNSTGEVLTEFFRKELREQKNANFLRIVESKEPNF